MSRERSVLDKAICGMNYLRFLATEALILRMMRLMHGHLYSENENPFITVYTPTYNRGEILVTRSVPSILNQTYTNFELLIIGDHCTDDTAELLKKFNDPRIRFYNIPKRGYRYPDEVELHWLAGPVVAANTALRMARGKWIARVDDDDTVKPEHLEESLRLAQDGNYEFVSALAETERHGVRSITQGFYAKSSYFTRKEWNGKGYNPRVGATSTWFYRSYLKFIKYNINCWRKAWNRVNDIDLFLRFVQAGVRIGFHENVHSYLLPRPGEATCGKEAYLLQEDKKKEHYRFID